MRDKYSPLTVELLKSVQYTTAKICQNYYTILGQPPTEGQASVFLNRSIERISDPILRTSLRGSKVVKIEPTKTEGSYRMSYGYNKKGLAKINRLLNKHFGSDQ